MTPIRSIAIGVICLFASTTYALDTQQQQQESSQMQTLKEQLFTSLSTGKVQDSDFDEKTELEIANTQIAMANEYLAAGNRKDAAISALLARKLLQRIYGTANDPRLIPVYSLLVQIYQSDVDSDYPNADVSDAAQAQLYRDMIDHIHAE